MEFTISCNQIDRKYKKFFKKLKHGTKLSVGKNSDPIKGNIFAAIRQIDFVSKSSIVYTRILMVLLEVERKLPDFYRACKDMNAT